MSDAGPTIEWRLFADLAELAGTDRVSVTLDDPTLGGAIDALVAVEPEIADRAFDDGTPAKGVTVLREGTRVTDRATELSDGDELAAMPPVSGG